ncbi:hypothetical protein [Dyadobacter crusticola]|uniref:hypothetical protein n=1 Tax=Dyadobacter crusticola TaxID=292407 RepID=UPI0004E2392F|nr:hypothetical protein [Dyadobacter crusticola]
MKILLLLLSALALSCNRGHDDNLRIKVVDSDDTFEYSATFDPGRSVAVERFINSQIAPVHITADGDMEVTTTLSDKTIFDYEASPGKLTITLDKDRNSKTSYYRIKRMCEGLNRVINPGQKKQ